MSRFRNVVESRSRFCRACDRYETDYRPLLDGIRAQTISPVATVAPDIDESLEIHSRVYLINALLNSLNWRLECSPDEGLPNLAPEIPVTSAERGTRRFLDYFGFETSTLAPVLIVETKRPRSLLPQRVLPMLGGELDSIGAVICAGIRDEALTGEWNKWLGTLRDYVGSVKKRTNHAPKRVVITNGDWLVLFLDPVDSFLAAGSPTPEKVRVWENRDAIEGRYESLFECLEHYSVLGITPVMSPVELRYHVSTEAFDRVMHGLRLEYSEEPKFEYEPSPLMKVKPVLFVRSRYGTWLCVQSDGEKCICTVPHRYDDLPGHLNDLDSLGKSLLEQVKETMRKNLVARPLEEHYCDDHSLAELPGVVEVGRKSKLRSTEFQIVTGTHRHYLKREPSMRDCPHHDWFKTSQMDVASGPGPVVRRTVWSPRSFFISTELHHCSHIAVKTAKTMPITAENRGRCGPRSGGTGHPFCEIADFEQYLCCRACVFEIVCTNSGVFRLPCGHTGTQP